MGGGLDTFANVGGNIIGGLLAAGDINRGGFLQYMQRRNALLQDPGFRASLGPFSAGLVNLGGGQQPQSDPSALMQAGLSPEQAQQMGVQVVGESPTFGGRPLQTAWRPNLPAYAPEEQLRTTLLGGAQQAVQHMTPTQLQHTGLELLGLKPGLTTEELAQYQRLAGPGVRVSAPLPSGGTISFGQPNAGRQGIYPFTDDGRQMALAEADWRNSQGQHAAVVEDAQSGVVRVITAPRVPPQPQDLGTAIQNLVTGLQGPVAQPPAAQPPQLPPPQLSPPGAAAPSPAPAPPTTLPKGYIPPEQSDLDEPLEEGRGYPSPAFVDTGTPAEQPPPTTPTAAAPPFARQNVPVTTAPLAPPGQGPLQQIRGALPPGTSARIGGPGASLTIKAPGGGKEDFTAAARAGAFKVLLKAKGAIKRLRTQGYLTDNPIVGSTPWNQLAIQWAARTSKDPQTQRDAVYLLRNLGSAVPLLARGFGEQRTNVQEEARLKDALSSFMVPASFFEAVIDNYLELFQAEQGQGGAGGPPPTTGRLIGIRPVGR